MSTQAAPIAAPRLAHGIRLHRLVPLGVFVLVLLVAILTITPWPVGVFEDDGIYTVLARSLATGDGYRLTNLPGSPNATHYPPGYPLVLAALWRLWPAFPDNVVLFKFANAVFLALAAFGVWTFARHRLAWSPVAAGAVALISTLSIVVLLVTGMVLSEPLFLALLLPALLLAERASETGDVRHAALAGLALGALALVRTLGALAIPAAVLVLLARRHLRGAIVLGAVAAALVAPWQIWVSLHHAEVAPVLGGKFGAYGPWMSEGYREGGWALARAVVARNLQGLQGMLGYMFMPVGAAWPRLVALATVVLMGLAGVFALARRAPVSALFLTCYLGVVLWWPFDANRFLWAVWPLLVCPVWWTVSWGAQWARHAGTLRAIRMAVIVAALVPAAGFAIYNVRGYRGSWWASIQRDAGQHAAPIVDWVSRHTDPSDVVATESDLIVHLYTGRRTTPVSSFVPRQRVDQWTGADDLAALRTILATYRPRFLIVSTKRSVESAEALVTATPALLRRHVRLPNVFVYETLPEQGTP